MCVGKSCPYHTTSTRVWGMVLMLAEKTCCKPLFPPILRARYDTMEVYLHNNDEGQISNS
jgi:hypothetical protein